MYEKQAKIMVDVRGPFVWATLPLVGDLVAGHGRVAYFVAMCIFP